MTATEEALVVQYRLSGEDLFRFNLAHRQFYWRIAILPGVMVASLFPEIQNVINDQATARECWATQIALFIGFLVFVVVVGLVWLYYRWEARQAERKILTPRGDSRLEITPECLYYTDRELETRLQWPAVSRIRLSRDHLCVYVDSIPAFIIPRRAFVSAQEAERFLRTAQAWHAVARR